MWVPNEAVTHFAVTGCRVFANGVGMELTGSQFAVTGNVFQSNTQANSWGPHVSTAVIANNVGA